MLPLILYYIATSILPSCICNGKEILVPMCNDKSKLPYIDELTSTDLLKIKSLEQLHILSRHGSRTGDHSVSTVFPNMNTSLPNSKWQCNFTTVTARDYNHNNWISLQKNYVQNEQITGGNCQDSQSIYKAVRQHKLNAQLIRKYYIGDKNHHLMDKHQFHQIISDIFIEKKYPNNNTPFLKIISTDLERCYTSVSIFMTHLLQMEYGALSTPMNRFLYTYTHDEKSDPYTPTKNANCKQLNKWMHAIQTQSTPFSEWINSDEIKSFFKQYEEEVGYDLTNKDSYKLCSNIVWMYCARINIIPHIISEDLFIKIHNFTIEYRKRLLHSGETSTKTTTLATMPFAWILRTLITDFIKDLEGFHNDVTGYLNAEKAKIVFHSTRGISTLLMLEPLGLSNGIQPIYANLVNLEIYSRNDGDDEEDLSDKYGYGKYLFRFTNMGKFIPFPKCDDYYGNGESTLCNLNVLIDRLNEYAMYLKDWEPYCRNVTESYFEEQVNMNEEDMMMVENSSSAEEFWYLIVGVMIGGIVVWFVDRRYFMQNIFGRHKYEVLD